MYLIWISVGGWPSGFYIFGGVGIIWFVAWVAIVTESPDYELLPEEEVISASNEEIDEEAMESLEESQKDGGVPNGISYSHFKCFPTRGEIF